MKNCVLRTKVCSASKCSPTHLGSDIHVSRGTLKCSAPQVSVPLCSQYAKSCPCQSWQVFFSSFISGCKWSPCHSLFLQNSPAQGPGNHRTSSTASYQSYWKLECLSRLFSSTPRKNPLKLPKNMVIFSKVLFICKTTHKCLHGKVRQNLLGYQKVTRKAT